MLNSIDKMAGFLMFASMTLTIVTGFEQTFPPWLPSLLCWLSAFLLISGASNEQRKISSVLLLIGLVCWSWAWMLGMTIDWLKAASMNQSLITLFIGVHFLRLVALPDNPEEEALPRGKNAFITTFLGIHILGAVINMSSVIFVGDRISRKGTLSKDQVAMLVRALASAAFWSPFFAGFGAAMVFAEESSLLVLLGSGMVAAIMALTISFYEFSKQKQQVIDNFAGFPLHFDAFKVPLLLAALVLLAHTLFPDFKVIILVALLSCSVTALILLKRGGVKGASQTFLAISPTHCPVCGVS